MGKLKVYFGTVTPPRSLYTGWALVFICGDKVVEERSGVYHMHDRFKAKIRSVTDLLNDELTVKWESHHFVEAFSTHGKFSAILARKIPSFARNSWLGTTEHNREIYQTLFALMKKRHRVVFVYTSKGETAHIGRVDELCTKALEENSLKTGVPFLRKASSSTDTAHTQDYQAVVYSAHFLNNR